MESILNSSNTSSDFEFKYIPKKEFEKMVTRVVQERKQLRGSGIWGSFCSVTSVKGDEEDDDKLEKARVNLQGPFKALTNDDIQTVIQPTDKKEVFRRITSSPAPFFGPARKLDVEMLRRQQVKSNSHSERSEESSEASSVHIVEEVNVTQREPDAKFQVQNEITVDAASECSSEDGKESLQSEMLKLCGEITNANGSISSGDSSVDLTQQEEKVFQKIIDKTEEKISCEAYSKFIDKKFDFLYDECKNSDDDDGDDAMTQAQTLPVVELRRKKSTKISTNEDFSNDNNVWIPSSENQIRKSDRQLQREGKSSVMKKRNDEVFPGDVIIRKAQEVGKLKRNVNEKSQGDVTMPSTKDDEKKRSGKQRAGVDEHVPSKEDFLSALGRITDYQNKISQFVDYLREIIEDPPEVEDMNDLKKRQKRATEFSNRFARNHLYQIGRIAEEVRLMPDNPLDVATKVNLLFQVIMHAVQTYLKNVEMFIYNSYPDKLLVLVDFVINATKICFDRRVFDKRDSVIQQMMGKCLDMKNFLMMNQRSMAKFASIPEKHKTSLTSRSSFSFENQFGSKLSMYDAPNTKQKPSTSRSNQRLLSAKSPYDALKPRNLRSSHSSVAAKSKMPPSRNQSSRVQSPKVKRSISNVSTAIQKVKEAESKDLTLSEKPLEEIESQVSRAIEKPKEMEIMEMLQSIAKEKVQEMLAPLLAQLMPKSDFQQTFTDLSTMQKNSETKKPSLRVTSDIVRQPIVENSEVTSPTKPINLETVEHVSKNVQYIYVKSNEKPKDIEATESSTVPSKNHATSFVPQDGFTSKIVSSKLKPPVSSDVEKGHDNQMKELKERALKERMEYMSQMVENPLYCNEASNEPWKMLAGISDQILDDILKEVVAEFDFGEKAFVQKFIQHELEC